MFFELYRDIFCRAFAFEFYLSLVSPVLDLARCAYDHVVLKETCVDCVLTAGLEGHLCERLADLLAAGEVYDELELRSSWDDDGLPYLAGSSFICFDWVRLLIRKRAAVRGYDHFSDVDVCCDRASCDLDSFY